MLLVSSDLLQIIGQRLSRACLWSGNAHGAGSDQSNFETAGRGFSTSLKEEAWRRYNGCGVCI